MNRYVLEAEPVLEVRLGRGALAMRRGAVLQPVTCHAGERGRRSRKVRALIYSNVLR
jgi:hypothetical protein